MQSLTSTLELSKYCWDCGWLPLLHALRKTPTQTVYLESYVAPVLGSESDPRSGAKKLSPHCGGTVCWHQFWVPKTTPKMEPPRQSIFKLLTSHTYDNRTRGNVKSNDSTNVYFTCNKGPRLQPITVCKRYTRSQQEDLGRAAHSRRTGQCHA